uniref:non-specific serine/threonine protein kinase n=1 Tax=Arcella intermedia TaxID=1963864 RepID=A0A6B2LBF2_9EUKA
MSLSQSAFVERYEISNEVLGQGYFAIVKVATDRHSKKKVAVKFVNKKLVEKAENLKTETSLLQRLHHPNIVELIDICDTKETLFIVMELMEGGELYEEIVRRKSFTEKDASYIMLQLLRSLDYLHSQGIVHRDLKLENLLLTKKNALDIKLADFGLSKVYTGEAMQTACGTPYYVAPEILLADGYGPKIDTWAAGVLLYVLLSGRLPFSGETDVDLFKAILEAELIWKKPQFDTVSGEAKDLIKKLIVKDPSQRYTAAQALQHPFILHHNDTRLLTKDVYDGLHDLSKEINTKRTANVNI